MAYRLLFVEPPKRYWFVMGDYNPPPTTLLVLAAYVEREIPGFDVHLVDSLGKGDEALHSAKHCLNTCKENGIGDSDLAFAYEAMARAYAHKENWWEADRYTQLAGEAAEAAEDIAEEDGKDHFLGELDTIPRMP